MTKFKKNTSLSLSLSLSRSLSLSLYLSICQCALIFPKGCACTSLSFSLFNFCKNGLDPDQTRMEFRKECFVNLKMCACDRKYAKCRTKADAHDIMCISVNLNKCIDCPVPCVDPEGRHGVRTPPPLKNHKNIEFLSNTGPDPLKFSRLPRQHPTLGHHRHASETPFKSFRWWADDGPLLVIFGSSLP